ncbi:MAG: GGDEF domain-containing protein [Deltaproteobacteria bacterium]|nr:GGDEF domain-containing protein [Deltaproteobacteria bacterium]
MVSGNDSVLLPSSAESSEVFSATWPGPPSMAPTRAAEPAPSPVAIGETLQFVHYERRGDTLLISGITPHGRRLVFEQREDRQGWYVVTAGRRRRPTERELGLVVATITQEMEAALLPERQSEVRSAYRLAAAADDPTLPVLGIDAYRDILLDEANAYASGQLDRLVVAAIAFQAFKRFANRHGHRVGGSFIRALGERLEMLYAGVGGVHVFHKTGKAFRLVILHRTAAEAWELLERLPTDENREWLVRKVWGDDPRTHRTHPDEVHFNIGIASAYASERGSDYRALAQRLSDDAYRAGRLGQFLDHTSLVLAKSDYRSSIYQWHIGSEEELHELAMTMDDGPAEVMAEMSDYLHELAPADLEGMAVAGDLDALIYSAIARDGFWQGTTAMRIAGERLLRRFLDPTPERVEENAYVGGFDLGDEFYGIAIEGDRFYFARGDVNSAGATRVKAGLQALQRAVGWRREDAGGVVGRFLAALEPVRGPGIIERIRDAAQLSFEENASEPELTVSDSVDVADALVINGRPISAAEIIEGAELTLVLPGLPPKPVVVLERRSAFTLRLSVGGLELPAVFDESPTGIDVKLRLRDAVPSAAVSVVHVSRTELIELLTQVREDNDLREDTPVDVITFLRHIADVMLEEEVKLPAKVEMALGAAYQSDRFVRGTSLEEIREEHPGLFFEAVHQGLLRVEAAADIDPNLVDILGRTMLSACRPRSHRS